MTMIEYTKHNCKILKKKQNTKSESVYTQKRNVDVSILLNCPSQYDIKKGHQKKIILKKTNKYSLKSRPLCRFLLRYIQGVP